MAAQPLPAFMCTAGSESGNTHTGAHGTPKGVQVADMCTV